MRNENDRDSQGPEYVRVGEIVRRFGMSRNFWRDRADQNPELAIKEGRTRYFCVAAVRSYLLDKHEERRVQERATRLSAHQLHREWLKRQGV